MPVSLLLDHEPLSFFLLMSNENFTLLTIKIHHGESLTEEKVRTSGASSIKALSIYPRTNKIRFLGSIQRREERTIVN